MRSYCASERILQTTGYWKQQTLNSTLKLSIPLFNIFAVGTGEERADELTRFATVCSLKDLLNTEQGIRPPNSLLRGFLGFQSYSTNCTRNQVEQGKNNRRPVRQGSEDVRLLRNVSDHRALINSTSGAPMFPNSSEKTFPGKVEMDRDPDSRRALSRISETLRVVVS